jgi:hypothetical protein
VDAATGIAAVGAVGSHYRVAHVLRRRLRVFTEVILKDQKRAYLLEILLNKHPAIARVRAVPQIGSVAPLLQSVPNRRGCGPRPA